MEILLTFRILVINGHVFLFLKSRDYFVHQISFIKEDLMIYFHIIYFFCKLLGFAIKGRDNVRTEIIIDYH
jgi:hypothetical protein